MAEDPFGREDGPGISDQDAGPDSSEPRGYEMVGEDLKIVAVEGVAAVGILKRACLSLLSPHVAADLEPGLSVQFECQRGLECPVANILGGAPNVFTRLIGCVQTDS